MKTAHFKHTNLRTKAIVRGVVTLKDDGRVSVSISDPRQYSAAERYSAKLYANDIVKANFIHEGVVGTVKESNKGLIDILRVELESLRIQFIEKTKVYAKEAFKFAEEQKAWTNEEWYKRYYVSLKEVPAERSATGKAFMSPIYDKNYVKMKNRKEVVDSMIRTGYQFFEDQEVRMAERHYEDSLLKLSYRIQTKGLDETNLKVTTSHIGVNINTTLTDSKLTVEAWTIIASGPIQRPHYRYLIR